MFQPVIELEDIMRYVGDFQRPFVEGSAIIRAKHIMECGISKRTENTINILALCLQTSKLDGKPHQIDIEISTLNQEGTISGSCSCKAGSGKSKHIVGVMLFLNRQPIEAIEDLSCTDVTQQWGKIKARAREMYLPIPVSQLCCVKKGNPPYDGRHRPRKKTPELQSAVKNIFLTGFPDSALAIELSQSRQALVEEIETSTTEDNAEDIRGLATELIISNNPLLLTSSVDDQLLLSRRSEVEINYYEENVHVTAGQAVDICLNTIQQIGDDWQLYRRPRVTGSRCYSIYTYNRNGAERDWEKKLETMCFSTFAGNVDTTYGKLNEPNAIAAYERQTGRSVTQLGTIVNHHAPWIGYSPDGVVADSGRLIEVKCLRAGRTLSGLELASQAKCVTVEGENISLKKKHQYYGQIQLGMLVTNLSVCDFVLYSGIADECVIIPVKFDESFTMNMLVQLRDAYFHKILPFLANRKK